MFSPLILRLDNSKPRPKVKISDFGMCRDIYESGSYVPADKTKKMPVKWMAPESFDEFTYKSDVVSWL